MALTPSEVASLARTLSRWEMAEYVSSGLVTLACIGEFIADFTPWFTGGVKEKKENLAKLSTLLLIASLSFELVCLVQTNQISGRVIGSLEDKADAASRKSEQAILSADSALTKAGSAELAAGRAKEAAGTAGTRAAGAQRRAEVIGKQATVIAKNLSDDEGRQKTLQRQIEEQVEYTAWRKVTDKQISLFKAYAIGLKGKKVNVKSFIDPEAEQYASAIVPVLKEAGIECNPPVENFIDTSTDTGIKLIYSKERSDDTQALAAALVLSGLAPKPITIDPRAAPGELILEVMKKH